MRIDHHLFIESMFEADAEVRWLSTEVDRTYTKSDHFPVILELHGRDSQLTSEEVAGLRKSRPELATTVKMLFDAGYDSEDIDEGVDEVLEVDGDTVRYIPAFVVKSGDPVGLRGLAPEVSKEVLEVMRAGKLAHGDLPEPANDRQTVLGTGMEDDCIEWDRTAMCTQRTKGNTTNEHELDRLLADDIPRALVNTTPVTALDYGSTSPARPKSVKERVRLGTL